MTALCSGLAAAAAMWLRRPDDWVVVRHRLGSPTADVAWSPPAWLLAPAVTGVVVVLVPSTATQCAIVALLAAGWFALRLSNGARRRAEAVAFRAEVARVVRAAAAELRAGVDPDVALRASTDGASSTWAPVRVADPGDLRTALQESAAAPGGAYLADIAAAWHLAEQAGAPLADILERMARSIQEHVELDREVGVEAGPARATARLMAVLPIFGLGLGLLLGVNPVAVLLTSGLGVSCLIGGLALACTGVWWIERIVSTADGR